MLKWIRKQKAVSTLEYAAVILFVLSAFLVFQRYIYRAIAGAWKAAGDSFGHGRQFDPRDFGVRGESGGTYEFFFDYTHCKPDHPPPCHDKENRIMAWIDRQCIEVERCDCTIPVADWGEYNERCLRCYYDCRKIPIEEDRH